MNDIPLDPSPETFATGLAFLKAKAMWRAAGLVEVAPGHFVKPGETYDDADGKRRVAEAPKK